MAEPLRLTGRVLTPGAPGAPKSSTTATRQPSHMDDVVGGLIAKVREARKQGADGTLQMQSKKASQRPVLQYNLTQGVDGVMAAADGEVTLNASGGVALPRTGRGNAGGKQRPQYTIGGAAVPQPQQAVQPQQARGRSRSRGATALSQSLPTPGTVRTRPRSAAAVPSIKSAPASSPGTARSMPRKSLVVNASEPEQSVQSVAAAQQISEIFIPRLPITPIPVATSVHMVLPKQVSLPSEAHVWRARITSPIQTSDSGLDHTGQSAFAPVTSAVTMSPLQQSRDGFWFVDRRSPSPLTMGESPDARPKTAGTNRTSRSMPTGTRLGSAKLRSVPRHASVPTLQFIPRLTKQLEVEMVPPVVPTAGEPRLLPGEKLIVPRPASALPPPAPKDHRLVEDVETVILALLRPCIGELHLDLSKIRYDPDAVSVWDPPKLQRRIDKLVLKIPKNGFQYRQGSTSCPPRARNKLDSFRFVGIDDFVEAKQTDTIPATARTPKRDTDCPDPEDVALWVSQFQNSPEYAAYLLRKSQVQTRRQPARTESPSPPPAQLSAVEKKRRITVPAIQAPKDTKRPMRRKRFVDRMRNLAPIVRLPPDQLEALERTGMSNEEWEAARRFWWPSHTEYSEWKTVPVFISSTFRDMHAERNVLTRFVFPTLNARCRDRRVRLVPIDLRWGLTEQDTSDAGLGALEHCLVEVEKARPIYIVLIGERYGWIPPSYRVSGRPSLQWVKTFDPGHSITDLELRHAILRKPYLPAYGLCYKRNPDFLSSIRDQRDREPFEFDYQTDPNRAVILSRRMRLVQELEACDYCKVSEYHAEFGGHDDLDRPIVKGLQTFEEQVTEDLWAVVQREFSADPDIPPLLLVERGKHLLMIREIGASFIGRSRYVEQLTALIWKAVEGDSPPIILTGAPGVGKTYLLARLVSQMQHIKRVVLIPHIVGASETSDSIKDAVLRLVQDMEDLLRVRILKPDLDTSDYEAVKRAFRAGLEIISMVVQSSKQITAVVLLLDGIDEMSTLTGDVTIDWLPSSLPPGIVLVASCDSTSPIATKLATREHPPTMLELREMDQVEQAQLASNTLSMYSKRLTEYQLSVLLQNPAASLPLFLHTCVEELRLQAEYGLNGSGVTSMISQFPYDLQSMLSVVLKRVEHDMTEWWEGSGVGLPRISRESLELHRQKGHDSHSSARDSMLHFEPTTGAMVVRDCLCILALARHGLLESELQIMMSPASVDRLPAAAWVRLSRSLDRYVRLRGDVGDGLLSFTHLQMKAAVVRRYLARDRAFETRVYSYLADFCISQADPAEDGTWQGDSGRAHRDLVMYLFGSQKLDRLMNVVGCIPQLEARARLGASYLTQLLRDLSAIREVVQTGRAPAWKSALEAAMITKADFVSWIAEFMVFLGRHSGLLLLRPLSTFQLAFNQPLNSVLFKSSQAILDTQLEAVVPQSASLSFVVAPPSQTPRVGGSPSPAPPPVAAPPPDPIKEYIPRRWFGSSNKQYRNRVLANFATEEENTSMSVYADGGTLATGTASGVVVLFHALTGDILRKCTPGLHKGAVEVLQYSQGDSAGVVNVWDPDTGTRVVTMQDHDLRITGLCWLVPAEHMEERANPSLGLQGRMLATTSKDSSIRVYKEVAAPDSMSVMFESLWVADWLPSPVMALDYDKLSHTLIAGSANGMVEVWDAKAPHLGLFSLVQVHAQNAVISALCVHKFGNRIAIGTQAGGVHVWVKIEEHNTIVWDPVEPPRESSVFLSHAKAVTSVAFSDVADLLASSSADGSIVVWRATHCGMLTRLTQHSESVTGCCFAPGLQWLYSAGMDYCIRLWDVSDIVEEDSRPAALSFVSATAYLSSLVPVKAAASKGWNTRMLQIHITNSQEAGHRVSQNGRHSSAVTASVINTHGTMCATGSQSGEIKVWDLLYGNELRVLCGHAAAVTALAFGPQDSCVVSGDADGWMMVWWGKELVHVGVVYMGEGVAITSLVVTVLGDLEEEAKAPEDPKQHANRVPAGLVAFAGLSNGHVWGATLRNGVALAHQPCRDSPMGYREKLPLLDRAVQCLQVPSGKQRHGVPFVLLASACGPAQIVGWDVSHRTVVVNQAVLNSGMTVATGACTIAGQGMLLVSSDGRDLVVRPVEVPPDGQAVPTRALLPAPVHGSFHLREKNGRPSTLSATSATKSPLPQARDAVSCMCSASGPGAVAAVAFGNMVQIFNAEIPAAGMFAELPTIGPVSTVACGPFGFVEDVEESGLEEPEENPEAATVIQRKPMTAEMMALAPAPTVTTAMKRTPTRLSVLTTRQSASFTPAAGFGTRLSDTAFPIKPAVPTLSAPLMRSKSVLKSMHLARQQQVCRSLGLGYGQVGCVVVGDKLGEVYFVFLYDWHQMSISDKHEY